MIAQTEPPKCQTPGDAATAVLLYIEQKTNAGEDAEPTGISTGPISGLLAVYDGMGGAGSAIVRTPEGELKTGAYCAARLAKQTLEAHYARYVVEAVAPIANGQAFAASLRDELSRAFAMRAEETDREPSKIRSSLIRRLPTTLAAVAFDAPPPETSIAGEAGGSCQFHAFWAGDSRAYLLDPATGLHQLTRDDVKSRGDAFENLIEDSPLSNCISADQPFSIHCNSGSACAPFILLAATDGCFGFLSTPAHFEYLLLDTLFAASNLEEWNHLLTDRLRGVTGDDATLALRAIGWHGFGALKDAFSKRCALVYETYVREIDEIETKLRALHTNQPEATTDQESLREQRRNLRAQSWISYRAAYERLIPPSLP